MPRNGLGAAFALVLVLVVGLAGCSTGEDAQDDFWQRLAAQEGMGVDLTREAVGRLDQESPAFDIALQALLMSQYTVGHSQGRLSDDLPQASVIPDGAEPYDFQAWKWELNGASKEDAEKLSLSALLVHSMQTMELLEAGQEGMQELDQAAVRDLLIQRKDLIRELGLLLDPLLEDGESANDVMSGYRNE